MEEERVSAQVILRMRLTSPTGAEITAAALPELASDRATVDGVRDYFEGAGFVVGPLVGISFAIEAPRSTFADALGDADAPDATRLPADVAGAVEQIAVTPPPAFGPSNP